MPFTSNSAKAAGSKGGQSRWKSKDPNDKRTIRITLKISPNEADMITYKSTLYGLSQTELLVNAVKNYKG
jgi:hypothetical protein